MVSVLAAIALIPSAPVLVPELTGTAAAEVADLRDAVISAASSLPRRWIAVGVGCADEVIGAQCAGTFAGFGADVPVGLSPSADVERELPLCALVAAWVRGQANPDADVQVRVYAGGHDSDSALSGGKVLRTDIERTGDPIGVLVVADGANTLTPRAPGGYRPPDIGVQHALDEALAGGDTAVLTTLPGQVVGAVAFAVLAGLIEPAPRAAKELYRGAPFGVGYFAGVWQP